METPRSVVAIIPRILRLIPESESELIKEIEAYADTLWNKAPEVTTTRECWIPLALILRKHITKIDTNWKLTLVKIFSNQT